MNPLTGRLVSRLGPRLGTGAVIIALAQLAMASPAQAVLITNELDCTASARVTGPEGTADLDVHDEAANLPREGTATWSAGMANPTADGRGRLVIEVGPAELEIASWDHVTDHEGSGAFALPELLASVPPGTYVLSGYHQGTEGRCEGRVDVTIGGQESIASTTAGQLGVVGTMLFAALLGYAARPRRRSD